MRIMVAIPVYDGKIPVRTMNCILNEQAASFVNGDQLSVNVLHSSAGIAQARNQLATDFMESDFDRLVFLDSDLTWEQGNLLKLAHHPVDYVGGVYRTKKPQEFYPVALKPHPEAERYNLIAIDPKTGKPTDKINGLIEMDGVATGFLALSRKVFQIMIDRNPDRDLTEQNGKKCHAFFQMPFIDGHLYGEDLYFSREWIESGGQIFIDPYIALTHWDYQPTPYVGNFGKYLMTEYLKEFPTDELAKARYKNVYKEDFSPVLSMEDSLKNLAVMTEKLKNLKPIKKEKPNVSESCISQGL